MEKVQAPLFEGLWDSSVFRWQDAFNHRPLRSSARALARSTSEALAVNQDRAAC